MAAGPGRPFLPCSHWPLPTFSSLLRDRVSQCPRSLWGQVLWRPALSMVVLVRSTSAQAAPWGLGAGKALSASPPPTRPPSAGPVSEEIQEGNQSGCQCPGERLAPQPPGPRSPAAALPVLPQGGRAWEPAGLWPLQLGGGQRTHSCPRVVTSQNRRRQLRPAAPRFPPLYSGESRPSAPHLPHRSPGPGEGSLTLGMMQIWRQGGRRRGESGRSTYPVLGAYPHAHAPHVSVITGCSGQAVFSFNEGGEGDAEK